MTRTIFYSATTLDGYIADENDSLDWLFVQEQDEENGALNYDDFIKGIGSLVMGRTTYEWVVDHIGKSGEKWPYEQPSWVFTHADLAPVADNITFVSGKPDEHYDAIAAAAAAAGDKDVWMVGGGALAAEWAEAGLLHELILYIAPVTLGAGRPLFPRPFDLRLVELAQNKAFACARYEVVGPRR
jgi:dihydrofolate reductase